MAKRYLEKAASFLQKEIFDQNFPLPLDYAAPQQGNNGDM